MTVEEKKEFEELKEKVKNLEEQIKVLHIEYKNCQALIRLIKSTDKLIRYNSYF